MVSSVLPLTVQDVSVRRRGKRLIGPIDLTLGATGFTILLGPNGSGKTTLLKALHGLERLSGGGIRWNIPEGDARKAQAFVFQSPIMLRRSVAANLEFPLMINGLSKPIRREKVAHWAGRIGLAEALERRATLLSGGEKQKLALARALICDPQVLFLDEPCANLDGRATREIEAMLTQANRDGTRIIMATHDMGQARRLASEVLFLLNGKIHETGVASATFDAPQTSEFKAFLRGDILE